MRFFKELQLNDKLVEINDGLELKNGDDEINNIFMFNDENDNKAFLGLLNAEVDANRRETIFKMLVILFRGKQELDADFMEGIIRLLSFKGKDFERLSGYMATDPEKFKSLATQIFTYDKDYDIEQYKKLIKEISPDFPVDECNDIEILRKIAFSLYPNHLLNMEEQKQTVPESGRNFFGNL